MSSRPIPLLSSNLSASRLTSSLTGSTILQESLPGHTRRQQLIIRSLENILPDSNQADICMEHCIWIMFQMELQVVLRQYPEISTLPIMVTGPTNCHSVIWMTSDIHGQEAGPVQSAQLTAVPKAIQSLLPRQSPFLAFLYAEARLRSGKKLTLCRRRG